MTPDWQPSAAELKAQESWLLTKVVVGGALAVAVPLAAVTGWWWALAAGAAAVLWMWIGSRR